jgi:uncharacterized protein (UPF0335 family)
MGWEGIGTLFGKVAQQFQGRIERLKNEREKLLKEINEIESRPPTADSLIVATKKWNRVKEIDSILITNAKDSA